MHQDILEVSLSKRITCPLIISNCIAHMVFQICGEKEKGLLYRKMFLYKTITSNTTIQPKIRTVKRFLMPNVRYGILFVYQRKGF